jgi:rhodanese-related sulfurtransferase
MPVTAIEPGALAALRDGDGEVAVLDVREPLGYAEGHIPESTLVPRRVLERRVPELVPRTETPVVLVDETGKRTARDAAWLADLGYDRARGLAGGVAAWRDAGGDVVRMAEGVYATAFNVPSKRFGETVEREYTPASVTPGRVAAWREAGEEPLVIDVRTPGEHRAETIPGAVNVEGVDCPAYVEALREPGQRVVVHCAGRTRSIVGTATLKRRGLDDVYALEDGTSGWTLAGFELERGSDRHVRSVELDEEERGRATEFAADLLVEADVERLSPADFDDLRARDATVYPFDVRTVPEFATGHVPDAIGIPGGQAIQRADDYVAVREGWVVAISESIVRAAITAYWYAEMGVPNVAVLDGGLTAWREDDRPIETGCGREERLGLHRAIEQAHSCRAPAGWPDAVREVENRSPAWVAENDPLVLDVGRSERYCAQHVPGSEWVSRTALEKRVEGEPADGVVLASPEGILAAYAGASLAHAGLVAPSVLEGGVAAWATDHPVEEGDGSIEGRPADTVPATAEQGEAGMRGYLDWERELPDRAED